MNKTEAIDIVNRATKAQLTERNTFFATVVAKQGEEGWWLNIPLSAFSKDVHVLLSSEKAKLFQHLTIKGRTLLSPAMIFRCKDQVADIFISAAAPKRLADQIGVGKHNFSKHKVGDYRF
jgi:hypothetical protein